MNEPTESSVAEERESMQCDERSRLLRGEPSACQAFADWLTEREDTLPMLLRDVLPNAIALRPGTVAIAIDNRIASYLDDCITEDDARSRVRERMKPDADSAWDTRDCA